MPTREKLALFAHMPLRQKLKTITGQFRKNRRRKNSILICDFLRKAGASPVLVDVGASGSIHAPWYSFAKESVFVGFDPDKRELDPMLGEAFKQHHVMDKVVVGPGKGDAVPFHLTAHPACSSMLKPNFPVLNAYLFADLFTIERNSTVAAITLQNALDATQIEAVDWLKVDSQGCDLDVLEGLDKARRDRLLCVEVEPDFLSSTRASRPSRSCTEFSPTRDFGWRTLNASSSLASGLPPWVALSAPRTGLHGGVGLCRYFRTVRLRA
jgi:FkbM family methyltransferase